MVHLVRIHEKNPELGTYWLIRDNLLPSNKTPRSLQTLQIPYARSYTPALMSIKHSFCLTINNFDHKPKQKNLLTEKC